VVAEFQFTNVASLPPQNVDAEESLLGAILLDSSAISRVADRLRPEAFFISAHSIIYKAALAIDSQGQPVDLMSITTWLYDHNLIERVGGQSKLVELLDSTVSSVNVDRYADLILDKYIRRQLIQFGSNIIQTGYETFRKLPEIFEEAKERLTALIDSPLKGEDPDQFTYNKICLEIQQIELGISDPGLRLWKLQKLAAQYGKSTKQLEAIYFMSLLKEENESMMTWKELCDKYGDTVREWILHGFLPKGVTVAVHARGGVGKTRLAYDMLYSLLQGTSWNGFPSISDRRAIIIQTDESAGDMLDALKRRGFNADMQNIRYKTRWTVEHIPHLRAEIEEFKPEVIVIDSITSVNRHSLFSENDVQYARPILKLKDLAQQCGCTIILVHHSSKAGEARGTSAIFNSVSEVWKLEKDASDKSPDSTKRLLTIEKSRSRRPTTYRLDFQPEEGSWTVLGEVGAENDPDLSTQERIVQLLLNNLNTRFEAVEIAQEINGSQARVRLCCARLAADGIISHVRPNSKGRGRAILYYLAGNHPPESDRLSDQLLTRQKVIEQCDHFNNHDSVGVPGSTDRRSVKNTLNEDDEGVKFADRAITIVPKTPERSEIKDKKVIAMADRQLDRLSDHPPCDHLSDQMIPPAQNDKAVISETDRGDRGDHISWTKAVLSEAKQRKEKDQTIQGFPKAETKYQAPSVPFKEGDQVRYEDEPNGTVYTVEACTHTHAQLKGVEERVNVAWLVRDNFVSDRPRPYHARTNPPKKGDRVRSGSGKAGQITLTRASNPRYEITWEDGQVMGYEFEDLQNLDIRRES
jgi:replicative DNA helicase